MRSTKANSLSLILFQIVEIILLPFVAVYIFRSALSRSTFFERYGCGGWRTLKTKTKGRRVIVFHAASIGEFQGLKGIISQLRVRYPQDVFVSTYTGLLARKVIMDSKLVDEVLPLPFDSYLTMRSAFKDLDIRAAIIAEKEIWPSLMERLSVLGAKIYLVNGKLSEKSFRSYLRFSPIFSRSISQFDAIIAQSEEYRDRFARLGAKNISVMPNAKHDFAHDTLDTTAFAKKLKLDLALPVVTFGSVRIEEEAGVVDVIARVATQATCIVAPRYIERAATIASLLSAKNIECIMQSDIKMASGASSRPRVLILDSVGVLVNCYAISTLCFVGGTFDSSGGHNPFEPARFGVPAIIGPNFRNQAEEVKELKAHNGIFQVNSYEELAAKLLELLSSQDQLTLVGSNAKEVVLRYSGSSKAIADVIFENIEARR